MSLDLEVGAIVAERTFSLTRDALVRYAGASGDFNSIHYRDDVAAAVGLPGVLAHGMLTMGIAVQPVVVDPLEGASVTVIAKIGALDESETRIDLTVTFNDATVLGKAQVRVSLT